MADLDRTAKVLIRIWLVVAGHQGNDLARHPNRACSHMQMMIPTSATRHRSQLPSNENGDHQRSSDHRNFSHAIASGGTDPVNARQLP